MEIVQTIEDIESIDNIATSDISDVIDIIAHLSTSWCFSGPFNGLLEPSWYQETTNKSQKPLHIPLISMNQWY